MIVIVLISRFAYQRLMIPDFATLLRPLNDQPEKENSELLADCARCFKCSHCPEGLRLGRGSGLAPCNDCGSDSPAEKLLKVEEHLRNYIEQLEEVIAEASDLEISSLKDSVCSDPAGISLLSPDHYLCLRLILGRAKFCLRIGDKKQAVQLWKSFLPRAVRLCSKLAKK